MSTTGRRQVSVTDLLTYTNDYSTEGTYWGEDPNHKPDNTIRIAFLNINTFPSSTTHIKLQMLRNFVAENKIDILGLSELNKCWSRISYEDQFSSIARSVWRNVSTQSSHNQINQQQRNQPGGTAIMSFEQTSDRIIGKGEDLRKLGRWTWIRTRGKNGITSRIVSAYRPVMSKGPTSTYVQQLQALGPEPNPTCPHIQFNKDLSKEIIQWTESGDHIVIGIDCNEDVTHTGSTSFRTAMKAVGLHEAIANTHQTRAPSTHNRGTLTIDSIFISSGLTSSQSGFTKFLEPVSDHRASWMDFSWNRLLGHHTLLIKRPSARRLQCDNPFTVRKYNDLLHKHCKDAHLGEQFSNLTLNTNGTTFQSEFNRLDELRTELMLKAEKKCRKIHMGHVPFSPEIFRVALQIIYWKTLLRKLQGNKSTPES